MGAVQKKGVLSRYGRLLCHVVFALGVWVLPQAAHAARVELRVLVIATGDTSQDPGRALCERTLDAMGVPYEVLDASRQNLTSSLLTNRSGGRFNGIILTQSEILLPNGTLGFDASEFALLHDYERAYQVRESVLSGFPATNPSLGLDYGMAEIYGGFDVTGTWRAPAGGTEILEYVNTENPLPTKGFTFLGLPRNGEGDPQVQPLLIQSEGGGLLFLIRYPDGREVLLSVLNQAWFFVHSNVLAYEFVNFATSGVFIGARHHYLSLHNDDMFVPDELWSPDALANYPEHERSFRLAGWEVDFAAAKQRQFRMDHPLASGIATEIAFNGIGATAGEDLTESIRENSGEFGFINHTYGARQMDWLCDEDPESAPPPPPPSRGGLFGLFGWLFGGSSGASTSSTPVYNELGCRRTDYQTAYAEIDDNRDVWRDLNLPDYTGGTRVLLTDSHSGLSDRRGTEDPSDDIPFPDGFNDEFGRAATALGITVLAGDASRENQNRIQRIPGHSLALLPRYPTALFYNASSPAELVSEYNYIFHDRYVEQGIDPCGVPAAICARRTYEEILNAEAETTLRHILSFEPFPHYFHQTNLHVYDEAGHVMQFDWMERVLQEYEKYLTLPIKSPRFANLADIVWRNIQTREAGVSGYLDTSRGTVTLRSRSSMNVEMTGVQSGSLYGGQRIGTVRVRRYFSRTYRVDRALAQ